MTAHTPECIAAAWRASTAAATADWDASISAETAARAACPACREGA